MKKLVLSFLLWSSLAFAQKKDTIPRFLNEKLELTNETNAIYYGVSVRRNDHWYLYALYPDTTPVVSIYFKDKNLRIKDGLYIVYYPKNQKAKEGYYRNNNKDSLWQAWYQNGNMKEQGYFKMNMLVDEWKYWYEDGQLISIIHYRRPDNDFITAYQSVLSEGIYAIKEGSFSSWYKNGNIEATGYYENDIIAKEWKWYYENGQPSTLEFYNQGKLTSLKCFDNTGKETGDFCSISKPATVEGIGDYKAYIIDNLLWPKEALNNKIEGVVKVSLSISKEGELKTLKIESDQPALQKAIQEQFNSFKKWYPAISHNRPIDWNDQFEIPFILPK